ncbi:MAG TPA: MarR family transcriptional regulator [Burkholderiaceae bacterium]|jgi:DNA-binding MarR family transcriptional regulator
MTAAIDDLFSEDQFRSADSIGHLLSRSRNMLAKSLDSLLAEYDITHTQGNILWILSTGRFSTATDLARELYIDAASMTRMIDRLEKRKLTVRMPRGDDRRIINLRLTPPGRILAEKLPGIYTAAMNRSFQGFTREEVSVLRHLLCKLLGNTPLAD